MLTPVVSALAEALRPRTEVVLHDLTKLPKSIVAIGGTITGRRAGGAITDLGMRVLGSGWNEHMLNYRTEAADGLVMRSSTVLFRAPSTKPVACLCINSDISTLLRAQEVLATLTLSATEGPQVGPGTESFPASVEDLTEGILSEAVAAVGVPVQLMKKSHKTDVVRELDSRGFFALREAADLAAQRLGVSRYSIYNYLSDLRSDGTSEANESRRLRVADDS
ncbi:MAG: helix-turn-helix transcriptional regulator [Acidimicrobiales bacterium]